MGRRYNQEITSTVNTMDERQITSQEQGRSNVETNYRIFGCLLSFAAARLWLGKGWRR